MSCSPKNTKKIQTKNKFSYFCFSEKSYMKKRDYIKTAQYSANQRIWDIIALRYQSITRNNKVFGVLWMVAACVVFGCIVVIGWGSSFSMLFRDLRFTPHYLRTAIVSLRLSGEQATEFLNASVRDYKVRLSYGRFSVKEQKRIETTFELLFDEFGTPKSDGNGSKSEVAENIETLTQIVCESNTELKTISNYTMWKLATEKEEIQRKQQMQEQQTKRTISAQNREKGRMLDNFEPALSDKQIDILATVCNEISMFSRDIEAFEMRDILLCCHREPLQVNVNKHIAVLFDQLREHHLICKTWMSVAQRRNCFVSKQGKPITSKDLSTALSTSSLIKKDIEDRINECIDAVIHSDLTCQFNQ